MHYPWIASLLLGACLASPVSAAAVRPTSEEPPLAYVYDGPGTCDGCADDVIRALQESGLQASALGPGELARLDDRRVALYAIPGGDPEQKVIEALGVEGFRAIRRFVSRGGRYLGVCLGAFVAAPKLANAGNTEGLALFDGEIINHSPTPEPRIESVEWRGHQRWFYFQDGPQFVPGPGFAGVIWARFSDRSIAALQAPYGQGKVGLLSIHPEATDEWLREDRLTDPDGSDLEFFLEFVRALLE